MTPRMARLRAQVERQHEPATSGSFLVTNQASRLAHNVNAVPSGVVRAAVLMTPSLDQRTPILVQDGGWGARAGLAEVVSGFGLLPLDRLQLLQQLRCRRVPAGFLLRSASVQSRFWLALLLVLSLWPVPAGAREPASGHSQLLPATDYETAAARAAGGFELLRKLNEKDARNGPRSPSSLLLRAASAASRPSADDLARPGGLPSPGAARPLCERLPYDATAPPSLR